MKPTESEITAMAEDKGERNVYRSTLRESGQHFELRQPLYRRLQEHRNGRAIVSLFISFMGDSQLEQFDANMLEEVLINTDCKKGISLMLNAPGGDGLAAERIIKICRSYSDGDFETIVPSRSKSAATIVCLGSDRILMGPTSELGPVDPQVFYDFGYGGAPQLLPADTIVDSYERLFKEAMALKPEVRIEPYLQQLTRFNDVYVQNLRKIQSLSDDIALQSAKISMLKGKKDGEIKKLLKPFTDPSESKAHGRGIFREEARKCGLKIEFIDQHDGLWFTVRALYTRCDFVVSKNERPYKLIETTEDGYYSY